MERSVELVAVSYSITSTVRFLDNPKTLAHFVQQFVTSELDQQPRSECFSFVSN